MRFLPLTFADIAAFLAAYPDDAEAIVWLADTDDEMKISVGQMRRDAQEQPPGGFPVVPTARGQYVVVGLMLSLPGPKFTLIPWEALKAQQGDGNSR
jgi:hypothetical protein